MVEEQEYIKLGGVKDEEMMPAKNMGLQQPADKSGALPNIIGNLEDLSVNENSNALFNRELHADSNAGASFSQPSFDPSNGNDVIYKSITPRKTPAQLQREADKLVKMPTRGHSKDKKNQY